MSKKLLINVSEEPDMINVTLDNGVSSLAVQTYFAFESSLFVVHLTFDQTEVNFWVNRYICSPNLYIF